YTDEHAHFLFQDQAGFIWGTNHEYLPSTDGNRNTLWRLDADLQKEIMIPPTEDPTAFSGVNFVITPGGEVIFSWADQLYRRRLTGPAEVWLDHTFGLINSLQLDEAGNLYVIDTETEQGTLYRVSPARELTVVATQLRQPAPDHPPYEREDHNRLYAAWIAGDGTVFVTDIGHRRLIRLAPDGSRSFPFHSEAPWYPVAYAEQAGTGYVLEVGYDPGRGHVGPRVVRLTDNGASVWVDVERDEVKERGTMMPPPAPSAPTSWPGWWWVVGLVAAGGVGFWLVQRRLVAR
ncbi:MAG: hypothetical protein KDC54_23900, partial [Lewinella sp.]|nr:hypothetical protein [Lewinella sp.]